MNVAKEISNAITVGHQSEVHILDLGDYIESLQSLGFHRIELNIDTTSQKYMDEALADVTILALGERYDRLPFEGFRA